jgi:hypothetical protein
MAHQIANPDLFGIFGRHHPDQEIVCFLSLDSR